MPDTDARVQFLLEAQNDTDAAFAAAQSGLSGVADSVMMTADEVNTAADAFDAMYGKASSGASQAIGDSEELAGTYADRTAYINEIIDATQRLAIETNLANTVDIDGAQEAIALNEEEINSLGATAEQMEQINMIQSRLTSDVKVYQVAINEQTQQALTDYAEQNEAQEMNVGAMRRGTRAATGLAFAAEGIGRGGRFAAIQMGMLAESIASLAEGTQLAEMATGIGVVVTVLGAALILWDMLTGKEEKAAEKADDYKKVWKAASIPELEGTLKNLNNTLGDQEADLDRLNTKMGIFGRAWHDFGEAVQDILHGEIGAAFKDLFGLSSQEERAVEGTVKKIGELHDELDPKLKKQGEEEKKRAEELLRKYNDQKEAYGDLAIKIHDANTLIETDTKTLIHGIVDTGNERQVAAAKFEKSVNDEIAAEDKRFTKLTTDNHFTAAEYATLLRLHQQILRGYQEEIDLKDKSLAIDEKIRQQALMDRIADNDPGTALTAKLKAIRQEEQAQIDATGRVDLAKRRAAQEEMALLMASVHATEQSLDTIYKATETSKNKEVRLVGEAANTVRRLEVGAEAAHAVILGLKYAGQSIAAFAGGDPAAGAGFAEAALAEAAAAAQGFAEAGGGGGSSGGGSGGGAGGGSGSTFTPLSGNGGRTTINLYTQNPYSGKAVQGAQYLLNQGQTLKQPVNVPPTTGLGMAPL